MMCCKLEARNGDSTSAFNMISVTLNESGLYVHREQLAELDTDWPESKLSDFGKTGRRYAMAMEDGGPNGGR